MPVPCGVQCMANPCRSEGLKGWQCRAGRHLARQASHLTRPPAPLPPGRRVGRTGRAGNKGTAITFIGPDEAQFSPDLVKALKESGAPIPQDLQVRGRTPPRLPLLPQHARCPAHHPASPATSCPTFLRPAVQLSAGRLPGHDPYRASP